MAVFPETHWSLILVAAHDGQPEAQNALATLFRAYWYPLFAYLRACGKSRNEAEDLLQGFFMHVFENQTLGRADRMKGPFRGFLIGCLKYFLSDQRDHAAAYKRGGRANFVSIDADAGETRLLADSSMGPEKDAERAFDRRWATLIMERAINELAALYSARPDVYGALKGFLTMSDETSYEDVAASLNVSQAVVKTTVHRMRKQFRELLRREVAMTVSTPHEIDDELRYLIQLLAGD
jgi:DNA-directed RNA polymerase specialized sigma24 family protein